MKPSEWCFMKADHNQEWWESFWMDYQPPKNRIMLWVETIHNIVITDGFFYLGVAFEKIGM